MRKQRKTPTLSSILHCNPTDRPYCFGTCKPKQGQEAGQRCANKLSATSVSRAVQVLETGSVLFRAHQPLWQCLQQLAPLVLCMRNHQDQADRLRRIWWCRILDEKKGRYLWDMVSALRKMGRDQDLQDLEEYLEDRDGEEEDGEEDGEDEDEDDTEGDENSSATETSQSTSTSTSTTQPCLPPAPKPLRLKRYSQARFATLNGLGPDHVFPKVPVQKECGICLDMLAEPTSPFDAPSDFPQSTANNNAAVSSEQDDPNQTISGDFWVEYDCKQWIWCKGSCGTTFHKECLEQWVDTVRYDKNPSWPTCPMCRMWWVF